MQKSYPPFLRQKGCKSDLPNCTGHAACKKLRESLLAHENEGQTQSILRKSAVRCSSPGLEDLRLDEHPSSMRKPRRRRRCYRPARGAYACGTVLVTR
jgi:hypothetical protein